MEKNISLVDFNENGLEEQEAQRKLKEFGLNRMPECAKDSIFLIFLRQFADPLIYILLFGACISIFLKEYSDGIFIFAILIVNSLIGCVQEYAANKSVDSLRHMIKSKTLVVRDGQEKEIDSEFLVPGDLVILKNGTKVPADIVLVESENLEVNESMLTGESAAIAKNANAIVAKDCPLQDRLNEVFASTMIIRGVARGIVKATASHTEMGKIADKITQKADVETPLTIRMKSFSKTFTILMVLAVALVTLISLARGTNLKDTLLVAVSMAVGVIPEALPITITIALSIGMINMSKKNVVVRNLSAVEALGSCTVIASDKTGTLTKNQLEIADIFDENCNKLALTKGDSGNRDGRVLTGSKLDDLSANELLILTSVLANEAGEDENGFFGDAVDIAFLKYARDRGYDYRDILKKFPRQHRIYYTSELMYSAAFVESEGEIFAFVKGAPEKILSMCNSKNEEIKTKIRDLAEDGFRVLVTAYGKISDSSNATEQQENFSQQYDLERQNINPQRFYGVGDLKNLNFQAIFSMSDPLREESKRAIEECQSAGINIVMMTGDSPKTAYAIAKQLNFVEHMEEVKSGEVIRETLARGEDALDELTRKTKVYSRMEPTQKLDIVRSMIRNGNFVAVTGDGVNDAPSLKNANVGIAMGKSGTDIARESADMVLMDDNFASITNAVREGRVVYGNIRKLIFFVVSCNLPEVLVYLLSLIMGLPIPFNATQLLWLNVITESIQNIFLAFERPEGNEMSRPPRHPEEPIFDGLMVQRCCSAIVVATILYMGVYYTSLRLLHLEKNEVVNLLMLLFVLVQNLQVFNSRSETKSLFRHSIAENKKLIFGVLGTLLLHVLVCESTFGSRLLRVNPLTLGEFLAMFLCASIVVVFGELEKFVRSCRRKKFVG